MRGKGIERLRRIVRDRQRDNWRNGLCDKKIVGKKNSYYRKIRISRVIGCMIAKREG